MSDWGYVYNSNIKLKYSTYEVNNILRIVYFKYSSNALKDFLNYNDNKIKYKFSSHPELEWIKALLLCCTDNSFIDYKSENYGYGYPDDLLVIRYQIEDGVLIKNQVIPYCEDSKEIIKYGYESDMSITNILLNTSKMDERILEEIKNRFRLICRKERKTLLSKKTEILKLDLYSIDKNGMIFKTVNIPSGYTCDNFLDDESNSIKLSVELGSEDFILIKDYIMYATYNDTNIIYPSHMEILEKLY